MLAKGRLGIPQRPRPRLVALRPRVEATNEVRRCAPRAVECEDVAILRHGGRRQENHAEQEPSHGRSTHARHPFAQGKSAGTATDLGDVTLVIWIVTHETFFRLRNRNDGRR